jgi:BirA family biotin operon repressor/biotin-[acetyl-CoA-carboxylase] ligase
MTFGQPLRRLETVDSTNTELLRWLEEDRELPEGAVVVTDYQSGGRGRWGRTWFSEPGRSLMFSVLLRPSFGVERSGLLTLAAGVACATALEQQTGLTISLKWPNDVKVGGRKLAGILAESQVTASKLDIAIVGMGINFEWPSDDLPPEVSERATSLSREMDGDVPPREQVLGPLLEELEALYGRIGNDATEREILDRATARFELIGQRVEVRYPDGRSIAGTAAALMPLGQLQVTTDEGTPVVVDVAEVERVRAE